MPHRVLLATLIALAVLVSYRPVLDNGFVNFDDDHYVTENPHVQRGLDGPALVWAWTTGHMANWHPLTWMSHMIDWQLFGPDPAGHHAMSLGLHVANTLLLFVLMDRMTGAVWRSALVAALFGLHPLHVESVAWVSERKDVLSTLLWLLTTLAYVGWVRRPGFGRYALVALGLALGLAAKPMLVTLPATLLLLDWWPLRRLDAASLWPRVREKLPLMPIVVASAVVTVVAQARGGAVGSFEAYPLAVRAGNAVIAYVAYLGMMVWPRGFAILYPYPSSVAVAKVTVCALVLGLVTAVAIRERRRRPYLLVGWLWYLGTLVPVIGLVQVGDAAMADRFTYVPLIGIFVAIAWLLGRSRLLSTLAVTALLLLAVRTRAQVGVWRSSVTLFSHAVAVAEPSPVVHTNLAFALGAEGDVQSALRHFERALALQERATAVDPDLGTAHVNVGVALLAQGRRAEARAHFEQAIAADPANATALNNMSSMLLREGRVAESLAAIDRALALQPDYGVAHANRAAALFVLGRYDEAWEEVRLARAQGHEPPAVLVRRLAEKMPEPPAER